MSNHPEKTKERILAGPAPRDIESTHFITMWENYADRVQQESGDRLAVDINGHRQVFRRQHDGLVDIEDIEHDRHLFAAHETTEGSGRLFVTLSHDNARFYDFDQRLRRGGRPARAREEPGCARPPHAHGGEEDRPRRRERPQALLRRPRRGSEQGRGGRDFVLLGHCTGKSNAAQAFAEYREKDTHPLHAHVIAVGDTDLSSAGEPELEKKAQELAGR